MSVPSEVVNKLALEYGLGCEDDNGGVMWFNGDMSDFANAIAKWQREKDAEICNHMDGVHDALYSNAILSQGE